MLVQEAAEGRCFHTCESFELQAAFTKSNYDAPTFLQKSLPQLIGYLSSPLLTSAPALPGVSVFGQNHRKLSRPAGRSRVLWQFFPDVWLVDSCGYQVIDMTARSHFSRAALQWEVILQGDDLNHMELETIPSMNASLNQPRTSDHHPV